MSGANDLEPSATLKVQQFLTDGPESDDQFGGAHDKVAQALAVTITEDKGLQGGAIALMGGWGSGKSTVVRLLQSKLKDQETHYKFFTFDTWAHQGDPVRRAFLEELIQQFKLGDKNKRFPRHVENMRGDRQESQSRSHKEYPVWSLLAAILVLLGGVEVKFLLAIAIQSSTSQTAVPNWLDWFLAGGMIIGLGVLGFAIHRVLSNQKVDLANAIKNQGEETVTQGTTRHLANTTIEYNQIFDECVEAICDKNQQLVLVIDNLDRLPKEKAAKVWAEMRNFFATEQESSRSVCLSKVWSLVPIAEENIPELFERSAEKAEDLIEKTFDLIFRVPPLIFSDWRGYFAGQTQQVFGKDLHSRWVDDSLDLIEERQLFTGQLERDRLKSSQQPDASENSPELAFPSWDKIDLPSIKLTPRWIKALINKVATLALQWPEFDLRILVLFKLYEEAWERAYGSERRDLQWPEGLAFQLPSDWPRYIVSLFYNTDPEKAEQVLWGAAVRQAMAQGNADYIQENELRPLFLESLERSLAQIGRRDGTELIRATWALKALRASNSLTQKIWEHMARRLVQIEFFELSDELAKNLCAALDPIPDSPRISVLKHLFTVLTGLPSIVGAHELYKADTWVEAHESGQFVQALEGLYVVLQPLIEPEELNTLFEQQAIPKKIPEDSTLLIDFNKYNLRYYKFVGQMLPYLAKSPQLRSLSFQYEGLLQNTLSFAIDDPSPSDTRTLVEMAAILRRWNWEVDSPGATTKWEVLRGQFSHRVTWLEKIDTAKARDLLLASLRIRAEGDYPPVVPKDLQQIAQQGHFVARLAEARKLNDLKTEAVFLLAAIWAQGPSQIPELVKKVIDEIRYSIGLATIQDFKEQPDVNLELIKLMAQEALWFFPLTNLQNRALNEPWAKILLEAVLNLKEPIYAFNVHEFYQLETLAQSHPAVAKALLDKIAQEQPEELKKILSANLLQRKLEESAWDAALEAPKMKETLLQIVPELVASYPSGHWSEWLNRPENAIWTVLQKFEQHHLSLALGDAAAEALEGHRSSTNEAIAINIKLLKYHLASIQS
ncbi:MAG: P-loop NTPase fold protein [bacterium]|nr:P-loop NTPase fold protein [bacterium]